LTKAENCFLAAIEAMSLDNPERIIVLENLEAMYVELSDVTKLERNYLLMYETSLIQSELYGYKTILILKRLDKIYRAQNRYADAIDNLEELIILMKNRDPGDLELDICSELLESYKVKLQENKQS